MPGKGKEVVVTTKNGAQGKIEVKIQPPKPGEQHGTVVKVTPKPK